MARTKLPLIGEFSDAVDNLGRIYIITLFVSGIIWAFAAINSFNEPNIFKIALIFTILLIFGFLGISFDRRMRTKLGLDSRIWENKNIRFKIGLALIFFVGWYLLFIRADYAVATAQSVGQAAIFSVSPTLNFLMIGVLGPLAEDIFFFGVINITVITLIREIMLNRRNALITAGLIGLSYFMFSNVPNAIYMVAAAAGALIFISFNNKNPLMKRYGAPVVSALLVGGLVFPAFHAFAYQLNERSFIAATIFGILMCLMAAFVGILPVDIIHILNNIIVTG
jgi:hypothetical protein